MSATLAEIADRAEIADLLTARARAADRFDVPLMRACHPSDATDNHGTYRGPMHGFIDTLESAMRSGPFCRTKQHLIGNMLFERRGADWFVETCHVAHEEFAAGSDWIAYDIGGRYLDTCRRVDGRWLIQHRDIVYDWSRITPAGERDLDPLTGTRDAADPLYAGRPQTRGQLPKIIPPEGAPPMNDLDRLLSKQAIAEVLYRRARAGDRADAELAHTCYHPGAIERHGVFDGLATDFIDVASFTRPKPGSPIKGMQHVVTNILADFEDDDTAFVESYHVAWCQMTDGTDATIGGRYLDQFARRDGRWAIVHRDVIFDWSRVEPETEKFWAKHPAADFLYGKRGAEDPLYQYAKRGS
ncbi:nuclear transport factor 2 family protein [Sphingomonas bacterium]|uniref:nuclear transport factor 2 family protein n=1 Tax=Sphingomonas bacterium TaxID=1895847 RepID=UPI001576584E|nr:nuclear transport factor 2 family protein [Sphingomonas bacterium]